jgi:hypothetical protein
MLIDGDTSEYSSNIINGRELDLLTYIDLVDEQSGSPGASDQRASKFETLNGDLRGFFGGSGESFGGPLRSTIPFRSNNHVSHARICEWVSLAPRVSARSASFHSDSDESRALLLAGRLKHSRRWAVAPWTTSCTRAIG